MAQMTTTTHPFDVLTGHQFISLTTYRKNGQPVSTPVWFAREGDKLYVLTDPTSGKVKRIRNNPRVALAPCAFNGQIRGEAQTGIVRILDSAHDNETANRALSKKYGWQKALFELVSRFQGSSQHFFIEIAPAP